ncbi:MAG: hypothetical protein ACOCYU_04570 [Brevefilum sp.]
MKASWKIVLLATLTALLGGMAAGVGFFMNKPADPTAFTTLRGQTVEIYGEGLYQFDTLFSGAGYKGQDAVALFLGVPFLVASILFYQRGSLTGHLFLTGLLGYFLYLYSSMALGAAYNPIFLVYVATFATSLFAFVLSFNSATLRIAALEVIDVVPARGLAIFMFIAGGVTLVVWGAPLVTALIQGVPPARMDSYSTMVTYALDLAVITPATLICASLLLRENASGVVLAVPLLTLIILLAPQIILSTIFQQQAGVPFTTGEMVGPIAGFVVLGIAAAWLLIRMLKGVSRMPNV